MSQTHHAVKALHGRLKRTLLVSVCAIPLLVGCMPALSPAPLIKSSSETTLKLTETHRKKALWQAMEEVRSGNLARANAILNEALSDDPENAHMHFLNAYVYEIRGAQEGLRITELAPAGYRAALNNDPLHWPAAYRLGLWHISQREYDTARTLLGEAALINDESPEIFGALAVASYHAYDPDAAAAFLRKAVELGGETPENMKASAIVNAALNNPEKVTQYTEKFEELAPAQEVKRLKARLKQWGGFHNHLEQNLANRVGSKLIQKAQFFGGKKAAPIPQNKAPSGAKSVSADAEKPDELKKLPGMLVIDAVIIRQKTSIQESRGKNLTKLLSVSFSGNPISLTQSKVSGTKSTNTFTNTYKLALGTGGNAFIDYSLNIANNTDSRTEVLARPSITVLDGETGTFFLGEEVTYMGGNESDSFDKEVGITFEVTPEILDGGKVRLQAKAEFDTFTALSSSIGFSLVIPTLKNKVSSTALLEIGQTLVFGGGTQEEKSKSDDSTPILGRIPGLQYFFSEKVSVKTNTSLIFLITPRLAETIDDKAAVSEAAGGTNASVDGAIMSQLRRRFRAWFDPSSNMTKALIGLSQSDLYREFRDGDLKFKDDDADGKFDRLMQDDGNIFLNTYEEGFGAELLRYFYFD